MIKIPIRGSAQSRSILYLVLLLVSFGCKKSQHTADITPSMEKYNLAYGIGPLQRFDLFLPEGHDAHTKVILLIHGGGWVSGNKEDCDYYAKSLSDFGFAALSMNYRLANDSVNYQEMLADIDSMIGCISKNAVQWGIGSSRIALFGYSAGGHLALLYSYYSGMEGKVASVVSLAGPTDIQDSLLWKSPGLYDNILLMAGDPLPVNWTISNPVHYVSAINPATLLIHGTHDSVVPFSQSLKLNQVLEVSGIPVTLMVLENETHYFSSGATEKFLAETKDFLDVHMK